MACRNARKSNRIMASVPLDNRAFIGVSGADAQHFLHNLVTADIEGLPVGEWRSAALLTAQGKVQFAFLVARTQSGFEIDCDGRDAAGLHKRLKFYRLRARVDLDDPETGSAQIVWDEPPSAGSARDARFAAFPVWRMRVKPGLPVGEAEDWLLLRIRHGIAEPHADYAYGDVFPHDINLDQTGGVSFKKGCYVGQEVVSRMQHRGSARWRVMIADRNPALRTGAEIFAAGKLSGSIGTVSGNCGLAIVRLDRIKQALDNGQPVTTEGGTIRLTFPETVTYAWPEPGAAR
jgi:tRNA-modifying protein YgfZ